ncbi:hypothetical protein J2Y56_003910 [Pseudomonas sp. BE134]|nr:hypothetical protein [Pseudomonas sp. BE134]
MKKTKIPTSGVTLDEAKLKLIRANAYAKGDAMTIALFELYCTGIRMQELPGCRLDTTSKVHPRLKSLGYFKPDTVVTRLRTLRLFYSFIKK